MNTLSIRLLTLILCAVSTTMVFSGCTSSYSVRSYNTDNYAKIKPPLGSSEMDPAELSTVISKIEERNKTVEDDPDWIKRAYGGLMVRKLNNLNVREYRNYSKYLDNGVVYVIVHPAFFPFFHFPGKLPRIENDAFIPRENVVERLLNIPPPDEEFAVLQVQERRMRDFLEFMSAREKLVIVVVPRHYNRYKGYKYRNDYDEYTRYLNEVTNFSESIIFAESRSPNRGYLTDEDGIRLMEFLLSVNAKSIYVGGGYIGRCLEDFYALLTDEFGPEDIFVVPELSDVSPRELTKNMAVELLTPEGDINKAIATDNLLKDVYRIQEIVPRIRHLPGEQKLIEAQREQIK